MFHYIFYLVTNFFFCFERNHLCIIFFLIFSEEPSPPSTPVVKETEATSIYLTWSPGFDGNAPIIQYIVEFKLRTRGWDEGKRRVVRQSNGLQVDGLRPASEYELRVYAVNKLGKSDASHYTTRKTLEAGKSYFVHFNFFFFGYVIFVEDTLL